MSPLSPVFGSESGLSPDLGSPFSFAFASESGFPPPSESDLSEPSDFGSDPSEVFARSISRTPSSPTSDVCALGSPEAEGVSPSPDASCVPLELGLSEEGSPPPEDSPVELESPPEVSSESPGSKVASPPPLASATSPLSSDPPPSLTSEASSNSPPPSPPSLTSTSSSSSMGYASFQDGMWILGPPRLMPLVRLSKSSRNAQPKPPAITKIAPRIRVLM